MKRVRQQARVAAAAAAACAALALCPAVAPAQYQAPDPAYAAPAGYYGAATSTVGPILKQQLNDIIDGHKSQSYDAARDIIPVLDRDPANPANVLLVYSGYSVQGAWSTNGTIWNREHVWCNSYGLAGGGPDYSDLFNLRPSNPNVNSDRNNEYYADVAVANRMPAHPLAPLSYEDNTIADVSDDQMWEPRAVEKGDLARSSFYMDTRYDGADADTTDLHLTDDLASIATGNPNFGHRSTLLRWHYQDGVSNEERRRSDLIQDYQNNRNPFVDRPELVWAVFGGGNNNSRLYVGAAQPASGASTTSVNLRAIVGAASWGAADVPLTKAGTNPTTFDVTTAGAATSASAGAGQTLDYDPLTRTIQVGLNGSVGGTVGAGVVNGTITVDNTDLTSGGAGLGADDGDDTIHVSGSVLDHAQPSFAAGLSSTARSVDFQYVPAGGRERSTTFTVHNRPAAAGAALTAGLDVDGVTRTGSSLVSTTVTPSDPAAPLAAGASRTYGVTLVPGSSEGVVSATHTIATSDENIPGAAARANLAFTTTARVTSGNFPIGGELYLYEGETFDTNGFSVADGAGVRKYGPGTMNIGGAQGHGTTSSLIADSGPVNFLSDANSALGNGLKVDVGESPVTFQSKQHLRGLALHGVARATVTQHGDHALVVGTLAVSPLARLNLKDNDLIVRNATALEVGENGAYGGVQRDVQRGYNGGAWDGDGIVTDMPDAATGLTTIAVATAGQALGIGVAEQVVWNGETVTGADVLAMYTYGGDTNFDGKLDADDYGTIDFAILVDGAAGYYNGDFNYDGVINADDYGVIDFNILAQGAPLSGSGAGAASTPGGVTAVPEPAAGVFALLAAAPLLARRRARGCAAAPRGA